jgi:hypothetical protein
MLEGVFSREPSIVGGSLQLGAGIVGGSLLQGAGIVEGSTPVLEERGDRQMRQKARVLTLIGVLTSSAVG